MPGLQLQYNNDKLRRAFTQSERTLRGYVDRAVGRATIEIANLARRLAPKAHSILTNSITIRRPDPYTGEAVAGSAYARMVEEGTGPGGWPSERTMLDWINVHNIQPRDPGMTQEDLAYVMARDIALHGTPAQPFMQPAFEQKKDRAAKLIDKALDDALGAMGA